MGAVLASSEQHVVTAAKLAAELGLPGLGLRAAPTSRNKYLQRGLFGRHNVSQLEHQLCCQVEHALEWAGEHCPVVVKPLSGMGGEGGERVRDEVSLESWYERHPTGMPFLVEQYLTGPEFKMEAIIGRVEVALHGLTEKGTTRPPYCVPTAHWFPADRPTAAERAAVHDLLAGVVRTLAISSGFPHLELRMELDGPHIMEVAVPTPGGNIMDMIQAANGFDLCDVALALAFGEPRLRPPLDCDGVACVWFLAAPLGVVTAIDGAVRVAELPGVVDMEADVEVGDTVPPLRSSLDSVAVVIARADDGDTLGRRFRAVQDELRLTVHPTEESVQQHAPHQHAVRQHTVHEHAPREHTAQQHTVYEHGVYKHGVYKHGVYEPTARQHTVREHTTVQKHTVDQQTVQEQTVPQRFIPRRVAGVGVSA
ncbi:hypothetical protein [Actinomadura chokoriensis]|uniref:ATP-grasp domain-containing protein n=1 Tax=Actinomadura chokoriensis TaxID=454156 RepID=UPI0031F737EA